MTSFPTREAPNNSSTLSFHQSVIPDGGQSQQTTMMMTTMHHSLPHNVWIPNQPPTHHYTPQQLPQQFISYSSSPPNMLNQNSPPSTSVAIAHGLASSLPISDPSFFSSVTHVRHQRTNSSPVTAGLSSPSSSRKRTSSSASGSSHKSKSNALSSTGIVFYEHNGIQKRAKKKDVMLPFEKVFRCKDKKNGMIMTQQQQQLECASSSTQSSPTMSPTTTRTSPTQSMSHHHQQYSSQMMHPSNSSCQPQSQINNSASMIYYSQQQPMSSSTMYSNNVATCSVLPTTMCVKSQQQPETQTQQRLHEDPVGVVNSLNFSQPPHLAGSPLLRANSLSNDPGQSLPSTSTGICASQSCKLTSKPESGSTSTFARNGRTSISIHELLN
ncbi:hypothetical protein C9374_002841 [Naegleria lovaniensis]|uniref:Uncharacterized protein n=1 Tax=Naegleria lovaniensis TaxID=51637 RepID=A0AA88KK56_NAELO|nr:uncharacterized protein C9374_002841 [Naegleria lovaniensis]KAG2386395.1 hypothetical protein C9374_002841 [Naegleria lovaniensis]